MSWERYRYDDFVPQSTPKKAKERFRPDGRGGRVVC